jgi:hypothetical protein
MSGKRKPFAALTITREADGANTVAMERLDESMHENNCPFCMLTVITAMQQALLMQQMECLAAIAAKDHDDLIKKINESAEQSGGSVH